MVVPPKALEGLAVIIAPESPFTLKTSYPLAPQISPAFDMHMPQSRAMPEHVREYATRPSGPYVLLDDAHADKSNAAIRMIFFTTGILPVIIPLNDTKLASAVQLNLLFGALSNAPSNESRCEIGSRGAIKEGAYLAKSSVNRSCSHQNSTLASMTGLSHLQRAISRAPLLAFDSRSS